MLHFKNLLAALALMPLAGGTLILTATDSTAPTITADTGVASSNNTALGPVITSITQTFTALVTGNFVSLDLAVTPLIPTPEDTGGGPLQVTIGDTVGQFLNFFVDRSQFLPPGSGDQTITLDIASMGDHLLEASHSYYVQLTVATGNTFSWSRVPSYAGGSAFYQYASDGHIEAAPYDFGLTARVEPVLVTPQPSAVPLPASSLLLLGGLGGLLTLVKRRKTSSPFQV